MFFWIFLVNFLLILFVVINLFFWFVKGELFVKKVIWIVGLLMCSKGNFVVLLILVMVFLIKILFNLVIVIILLV